MQIDRSIQVNAPLVDLWRILAIDYDKVAHWARAVTRSDPLNAPSQAPDAEISGRACKTAFGIVEETMTAFDPIEHELVYVATGRAISFFVKQLSGRWKLDAKYGGTAVTLTFNADLRPIFAPLMGWMIRRQFDRAITDTLQYLKHFAETGDVHLKRHAQATDSLPSLFKSKGNYHVYRTLVSSHRWWNALYDNRYSGNLHGSDIGASLRAVQS